MDRSARTSRLTTNPQGASAYHGGKYQAAVTPRTICRGWRGRATKTRFPEISTPAPFTDLPEPLLRMPFYLSPGWLRIDPTFAPLKGNPRLERLVAGK